MIHPRPLRLLPERLLIKTSAADRAHWNYGGILGYVSRQRFRLAADLLPTAPLDRILEVGYGSGIFLPELAKRAARVSGIDRHDRAQQVTAALAQFNAAADLGTGVLENLPYASNTFDAVVAISVLEFVADPRAALRELARVLRPSGRAIVVTPGDHPLLDIALRMATGASARIDFGDRRARVIEAVSSEMAVAGRARFPRIGPVPLYRAFALAPQRNAVEGELVLPHGN